MVRLKFFSANFKRKHTEKNHPFQKGLDDTRQGIRKRKRNVFLEFYNNPLKQDVRYEAHYYCAIPFDDITI